MQKVFWVLRYGRFEFLSLPDKLKIDKIMKINKISNKEKSNADRNRQELTGTQVVNLSLPDRKTAFPDKIQNSKY